MVESAFALPIVSSAFSDVEAYICERNLTRRMHILCSFVSVVSEPFATGSSS